MPSIAHSLGTISQWALCFCIIVAAWLMVLPERIADTDVRSFLPDFCHWVASNLSELSLGAIVVQPGATFGGNDGEPTRWMRAFLVRRSDVWFAATLVNKLIDHRLVQCPFRRFEGWTQMFQSLACWSRFRLSLNLANTYWKKSDPFFSFWTP